MKNSTEEIRRKWIDFFKEKDHLFINRSNVVPINDESILFINSGVATLKNYFMALEIPPSKRMVNIQPVIRTGDIDNIGKTSRHHTFFEMLGNFSINDYFKKEAIKYAYEFLTSKDYLNIDKNLLYITVYSDDEETKRIWLNLGIDRTHIFSLGRETNFWDLGVGPCGPSTEIFYDRGKKYSNKNAKTLIEKDIENDRFIEIWNIVFSEFNNDGSGKYTPLPQKNIDTGAGLERIASCLQDTPTNFEIDNFKIIIESIEKLSSHPYKWDYIPEKLKENDLEQFKINSYFKAIADFLRTATFAINDGVRPTPNGRGYVIRRLIRKAILNGRKLKIEEAFLYKIVPNVILSFDIAYPELKRNKDEIIKIIKDEEEKFFANLKRALILFKKEDYSNLTEEKAFMYYETYGLPMEFIYELLSEFGVRINKKKMETLYKEFKEKSRENMKKVDPFKNKEMLFLKEKPTEFVGYSDLKVIGKVIAIQNEYVAFDKTPFYATSGGQIFDIGKANDFDVTDVEKNINRVFIHKIPAHNFKIGEKVILKIDEKRRTQITLHHSATHLIFSALEIVLDTQLNQVGSKVTDDELRFDFYYNGKITDDDLKKAIKQVQEWIFSQKETITTIMSLEEAKDVGANFLESAKYGNEVRVVKLNEQTIDLCGGTHVTNLKQIEDVKIINFERKGSNVYRITALAGFNSINEYMFKKRSEEIEDYLERSKKIEEELHKKIDFYDPKFLIKINLIIENIKKIRKSDDDFDIKLNHNFDELEKVRHYVLKEIKLNLKDDVIRYLNNAKDEQVFKVTHFPLKELTTLGLDLITNYKEKILKFLITNEDKLSLVFILTTDLIDSKQIKDETEIILKIGLRGSGKKQLYIYGGKIDFLREINKKYKIWNEMN